MAAGTPEPVEALAQPPAAGWQGGLDCFGTGCKHLNNHPRPFRNQLYPVQDHPYPPFGTTPPEVFKFIVSPFHRRIRDGK